MKSRLSKVVSREDVTVILAQIMIVCLVLAIIGGTLALIWDRQSIGATAGTVADTFAWIFAAAFLTAFGLATHEEHKRAKGG